MKAIILKIVQNQVGLFSIPSVILMTCVFPVCYPFTILQSFAIQGLIFLMIYTLILFLFRQITVFAFSFLCCLGITIWFFPFLPAPKQTQDKFISELTIAQFNVDFRDGHYQKMIHTALETEADIIAFQEVSQAWSHALIQGLKNKYPHYRVHTEYNRGNGLAVFAKKKFLSISQIRVAKSPFFLVGMAHDKGSIFFMIAHVKSPALYHDYLLQQKQFEFLTKVYAPRPAQHRFLIGDLNAVTWSSPLKSFLKQTDLQDSRYELLPTFPRKYSWTSIPIDHILHSSNVKCVSLEKITTINSDHAGIIGKYVLEKYHKSSIQGRHLACQ